MIKSQRTPSPVWSSVATVRIIFSRVSTAVATHWIAQLAFVIIAHGDDPRCMAEPGRPLYQGAAQRGVHILWRFQEKVNAGRTPAFLQWLDLSVCPAGLRPMTSSVCHVYCTQNTCHETKPTSSSSGPLLYRCLPPLYRYVIVCTRSVSLSTLRVSE